MTIEQAIASIQSIGRAWPADSETTAGFVICAQSAFDRQLIRRWLEVNRPRTGSATFAEVEPSLDDSPFHRNLDGAFLSDDNRSITPLTVIWTRPTNQSAWRNWLRRLSGRLPTAKNTAAKERLLKSNPNACSILVGAPATISELRQRFETKTGNAPDDSASFSSFIARQAILTLDQAQRAHSGSSVKIPRFVIPTIMSRADFRAELEKIAKDTGRSITDVNADARKCLAEIAPKPSPIYIDMMARFMRTVCSVGYDKEVVVDDGKLAEVRKLVQSRPTAFMFTHKSHVDGPALYAVTHQHNFPLVHLVGGINMAIFGIGSLAKRGGAIFIRRSFRDDPVYRAALQKYLAYVLEKRFPLAWALEGTRSRIGKLMPPRYGILKYVVEAAHASNLTDLQLIPVSINYDLIPEIDSYASEQTGAVKRKESLAWFVGYIAGMRKPLGRIFMDFGDPIIVGAQTAQESATKEDSLELRKIAFEAAVNINAVTPLTASGAVSFVMMSASPQALSEDEIVDGVNALREWAISRKIPCTSDFNDVDISQILNIVGAMINVGVLQRHDGGIERLYSIAPGKSFTVSYYRNTVMHFFVTSAIIELALAKAAAHSGDSDKGVLSSAVLDLRDLFKLEFFYRPTAAFMEDVDQELSHYDLQWKDRVNGQEIVGLLEEMKPLFAHGVLKPFIEAYSIVAEALLLLKPGETSDEKAIVATCLRLGRDAVLRQRISGEESIAKLFYSNGYQLAAQRGLANGDDPAILEKRRAFALEMKDWRKTLKYVESIDVKRRAASEFDRSHTKSENPSQIRAAQ